MRERLQVFVLEAVAEGSFAPSVPVEDLFSFMAVQCIPEAYRGDPVPDVDATGRLPHQFRHYLWYGSPRHLKRRNRHAHWNTVGLPQGVVL